MIRRLQSLFAETTPLKDVYRSGGEIKGNLAKEGLVGNPSHPAMSPSLLACHRGATSTRRRHGRYFAS